MKYLIILILLLLNPLAQAEEEQASFFDGTKTIHLKFTDVIDDKFTVNVLWTPDDGYVPRLVGPATISFTRNSGGVFSVSAVAFHLPLSILNGLGFLKFDEDSRGWHTIEVDLTKVYPVNYKGRASLFDNFRGNSAPFFFEDIDFDGKDELIVVDFGTGQRWVDEYTVYKSNDIPNRKITYRPTYPENNSYNLATTKPFNMLDQKTTFDKENRTIDVFLSGGASGSTNEKFKLVNGEYKPVEFTEFVPSENAELGTKSY